ncbi:MULTISPECIES: sensor histidine kinase KdpD [unclassified Oceanispirochaeta]|uniref:sensor histidine kinase n=1 Tax=unclassified Oceanispirochaeta TaxID=2635722 RepID=UPI000E08D009|nr:MULTISPECIES: HAMP domain-containing sensor histidine kinase [unclassified Oceanispirochaeta]MBF9018364.1 HAMP domain-containing histidine kinase [Oceanispirochaeta sp. M2]NPD74832.1 HAMP domain-containing histidine kinase [Oceanispirochaeta sp. M1]RDG29325.1 sensor histidine kinase [Oceanispirochaeta sp. M1]
MTIRGANISMYMINIFFPVSILLTSMTLYITLWQFRSELDTEGLRSKRFIHETLLDILETGEDAKVPEWVSLVVTQDGTLHYLEDDIRNELMSRGPTETNRENEIIWWTSAFISYIPDRATVLSFSYKGIPGICVYHKSILPLAFQMTQEPVTMAFALLIAMMMFVIGAILMNSHHRNVKALVEASKNIINLELDKPVKFTRRNELAAVFNIIEELRQELKETRDRAIIMLSSLAHDMKTPLTSMRVYLEAMNDGIIPVSDEAGDAIKKALKKGAILEERIEDLLYIFKGISTTWIENEQLMDINAWLKEISALFREESSLKSRQYSDNIQINGPLVIRGDKKMLTRALHNIHDNACRYSLEDDKILFSAFTDSKKGHLILLMEDSGPGVKEEDRSKIFDIFYRNDNGRNSRGMGIGLASVRFLINEYEGTVKYKTSRWGGAGIEITLPLAESVNHKY